MGNTNFFNCHQGAQKGLLGKEVKQSVEKREYCLDSSILLSGHWYWSFMLDSLFLDGTLKPIGNL